MDLTIAIEEPATPHHEGSPRVGAVWNREGQRKSPDGTSFLRKSQSSGLPTPSAEVNYKRRMAAAEFIKQCTGLDIPYSNDLNFRKVLRDGTILCETLNKVVPGAVKISASGEDGRNVGSYLAFLFDTLRCPSDARFSPQDLQSEGYDDRPRVAESILFLQRVHVGQESLPTPMPGAAYLLRESSDVQAMRDSPRKGHGPIDLVAALAQQHQKQQQAHMSMVLPTGGRAISAIQPNANLAVLYNDISKSLVSRLSPGAQPTAKYDHIVSNVMEQFLNGLTIEYERRLLAKDQELNASKEALSRQVKQIDILQAQLDTISSELQEQRRKEVDSVTQASQQRLQELEEELAKLRLTLVQRSDALAKAEATLGSHDLELRQQHAELEAQLQAAQRDLESFEAFKQRFNAMREENKKMYNTIQDLKGSIRVFCRVRPAGTTGDASPSCLDLGAEGELAVYDKAGERKVYKFDRVFGGDSTQEMVYEDVQTLIRSVMDGYNVCIFAYGQTGSGKTHTMTGSHVDDLAGRGINFRALDDLFALQSQRDREVSYAITAQMLEIYNETIRDLLTEEQGSENKLDILSTQPSGLNVPGATQIPVSTTADVLTMMRVGARNRHSAGTRMNERSSRSHQVLTIIVDGTNMVTGARTHACLHLVDLAGSERTDKSGVEGDRLREANAINTSLSALGSVMHSLASKAKHIPFRNSKLTELLADSLSGQAKVCMLMHVAPEGTSHGETLSTLNFGNRVASVTLGQAKCNVESGKVFEAHEALAKKDRANAELTHQLQLAREQQAASQRQLLEQSAIIQSLRAQVAALGGDVSMPSVERSESYRITNSHAMDSAASTPVSMFRAVRPSTATPRTQTAYTSSEHPLLSQTPRSASQRSPGPPGLSGAGRSGVTPRSGSLHMSTSLTSDALADQHDRLGPLHATRSTRGQQQAGASSTGVVAAAAKPGAGTSGRQLPPPIPRIDTSGGKPSVVPSGSMSARPSSRHTGQPASNTATSPTMAAGRRTSGSTTNLARPATSRSGNMYGSTGSLSSLSLTSSMSVVLTEPTSARGSKPPLSSRPSTGWK